MDEKLTAYEEGKEAIRLKKAKTKAQREKVEFDDLDLDRELMEAPAARQIGFADVVQVGSKVVIGAGLGLLAGVAAIAVTASMAEIILAGVVTKIAGVVGGGAGLSLGLRRLRAKRI